MNANSALAKRAKDKDMSAFEELVRIHQNKVYTLCLRLSSNRDDAQDLAQEAFIRAYKAMDSFRNEADFGTWLYRITVNVCMNARRKNSGKQMISLDEPYQGEDGSTILRETVAEDGDPLQALEEKEFHKLVRLVLQELSPEQRAVIVLREIEGYSYEEIAHSLDCSLGTVKSRLNRAREVMRHRITELASGTGGASPTGKERR